MAANYGLSESNVCRTIRKVENALIQSKVFSLPKYQAKMDEIVIIDVSESPIERPKKSKDIIAAAKRNDTPLKSKSSTVLPKEKL